MGDCVLLPVSEHAVPSFLEGIRVVMNAKDEKHEGHIRLARVNIVL